MKIIAKKTFVVTIILVVLIIAGVVYADEKKKKAMPKDIKTTLQNKGVKIQWKDDDAIIIVEGFPYRKDITGNYSIEIIGVDKGVFTATKSSVVPTEMMGMVYGVAGGSFIAQCDAEEGTQTLADAVGNTWVFTKPGISFNVYLPNSKKPAYALKSKLKGSTISFTKDGVLIKGFSFVVNDK